MTIPIKSFLWLTCALPLLASAAPLIFWAPTPPSHAERVTIEVAGTTQGGVLHWGVNGVPGKWQEPISAYHPAGSSQDGVAVRTLLRAVAGDVYTCTLGPFNDPAQDIENVIFVIQWADGSWDNNGGKDYIIPVGRPAVKVTPEKATWNDTVRIAVEDVPDGAVLHWGVNAAEGSWQRPDAHYQPGGTVDWDISAAVETPLPKANADGVRIITLGPFNHGAQIVTSLHCVVRHKTTWDTNRGRNYGASIGPDPHIAGPVIERRVPQQFTTAETNRAAFVLPDHTTRAWLNGSDMPRPSDPAAPWMLPDRLALGRHTVTVRTGVSPRCALQTFSLWHVPELTRAELPTTPPVHGTSVLANGHTRFVLYAPGKRFVRLMIDANAPVLMTLAPGGYWWTERDLPGGRITYQYDLEGEMLIADPYARDLDWVDESGKESGRAEDAHTVLDVGASPYPWRIAAFKRPDLHRLLIYECAMNDLCPGEGFTGMIAQLDAIRALGCNAIELLPVMEFPGEESWGYNPAYHMAPESVYGTPDELKTLIDACHARGMAFIVDMVLNHADGQSALHQLYGFDYEASPYFRHFEGDNWGFPDLDQDSPALQRYVRDVVTFWLREYRVDGFRYDATRWTGWGLKPLSGAALFAHAAKQVDPTSYQIAEHLPEEAALVNDTEIDAQWDASFRWQLRDMLKHRRLDPGTLKSLFDATTRGSRSNSQRIVYTESHDEERVLREMLEHIDDPTEAVARARSALVMTLTAPGPAMVYAGQEFGVFDPKIVGPNPLPLHQADIPMFATLVQTMTRTAPLKTSHPALATHHTDWIMCDGQKALAAYRLQHGQDAVIVAVNFGSAPQRVTIPVSAMSQWRNVLEDAPVSATSPLNITLLPGDCGVWATEATSATRGQ